MRHFLKQTAIFILHTSIKMRSEVLNYIYCIISQASQASPKKNIVLFVRLFVFVVRVLFLFRISFLVFPQHAKRLRMSLPKRRALQEIARDKAND